VQGWSKMAELRAKEAKLDAKVAKLQKESSPEIEKGKTMLKWQHNMVGAVPSKVQVESSYP
jgi:hypothetical protein